MHWQSIKSKVWLVSFWPSKFCANFQLKSFSSWRSLHEKESIFSKHFLHYFEEARIFCRWGFSKMKFNVSLWISSKRRIGQHTHTHKLHTLSVDLKIRNDADITTGLLLLEITFPSVHFNLVALGIKHSLIIGIIKLKHRNKAKCNNKPLILRH